MRCEMQITKDKLSSLLNLRSNYLTGSRFKGGRSLETKVTSPQVTPEGQAYGAGKSPVRIQTKLLSLAFFFLLFFFTGDWKPGTGDLCFSDEIRIRTIVTPIGSQSEKWGAAGLMVCIGGEPINQGGCGSSVTKGWKIKEDGTKEQIEIKNNDIIIFKDTYPSANPNHQFDGGSVESWADTIYEVRGSGGEVPEGAIIGVCKEREQICAFGCSPHSQMIDCTNPAGDAYCESYTGSGCGYCSGGTQERCACSTGNLRCYITGEQVSLRFIMCFCVK